MGNKHSKKNQRSNSQNGASQQYATSKNVEEKKQEKQKDNIPWQEQKYNGQHVSDYKEFTDDKVRFQILEKEDQIVPYQQLSKETQEDFDPTQSISLELKPTHKVVQISSKSSQTLPAMVSLVTKSLKNQPQRAPIDLVCVIDVSGSMSGMKIKLVRKSIRYLLKMLNENDRICLIAFETTSRILNPFLLNKSDNKQTLKKAIKELFATGGTNIHYGIDNGLWMLKNRKYKNPVSCLCLLSDGADNSTGAEYRVKQLIEKYKIEEEFTIFTYGYGNDHDPNIMTRIAQLKGGSFYYIENLKTISEWFVLSLSGILTVLGDNVEITVNGHKQFEIVKRFGKDKVWLKRNDDYAILMPHLVQDTKKEYLFEIEIPRIKEKLKDEEKQVKIAVAELVAHDIKSKKIIKVTAYLQVNLINEDEKVDDIEFDPEVESSYIRAKGAEIIGEAVKLNNDGKYKEAEQLLDDFLKYIDKSKVKDNKDVQYIKMDCEKSKDLCKPQVYEQKGKAFMFKKEEDHYQRKASFCCQNDWNQCQQEMIQDYNKGNMNLSDDSCEEDNYQVKNVQRKNSGLNLQQNRKYSGPQYSGSDPDSPKPNIIKNKQQQQFKDDSNSGSDDDEQKPPKRSSIKGNQVKNDELPQIQQLQQEKQFAEDNISIVPEEPQAKQINQQQQKQDDNNNSN